MPYKTTTYTLDFNERVALQVALCSKIKDLWKLRNHAYSISAKFSVRTDLKRNTRLLRNMRQHIDIQFA